MSDEQYALSPAPSSPPPTEADYEAIFAAVMETVRGRWFLSEFARRNRHADTQMVLAAIDRLQSTMHGERADPTFERIRTDIRDMAEAIAATRREIAAIRPDREHTGIGEATEELGAIVMATERATSEILAAAETIQEMAWTLREQGLDANVCDKLDACATDVYLACSFQDLTGQRTRKVINVLRYLEERINAMVEILGGEAATAQDRPAPAHDPLDTAMDQAEIDAVMPAVPAGRAAAARTTPDPMAPPTAADMAEMATTATPAEIDAGFDASPVETPAPVQEMSVAAADPTMIDRPDAVRDLEAEPAPPSTSAEGAVEEDATSFFADVPAAQPAEEPSPASDGDQSHERSAEAGPGVGNLEVAPSDLPMAAGPSEDVERETTGMDIAGLDTAGLDAVSVGPESGATTEAPQELVAGVAPNTAALLADLLAIIRPASETDADFDVSRAAQNAAMDGDGPPEALAEYTPSKPLDLRLLQPITLHSDFVIVPLGSDDVAPAEAAATEAAAVTPTNMLADAAAPVSEATEMLPSESVAFEEAAPESPTDRHPDEPAIETMAEPVAADMAGLVATAQDQPAEIEPAVDAPMNVMADEAPSEPGSPVEMAEELAAHLPAYPEILLEETGADEAREVVTAEPAGLDFASETASAPAEAEASSPVVLEAEAEDSPAEPPETIGVVGLDDDLLMAPVDSPSLAEPATDSVTHSDMDLLLPAEAVPGIETVPAIDAEAAEAAETAPAPDEESADADLAPADAPAQSVEEEMAADESAETAPPVAAADEPPPPAAEQAPVPPAYAAAFLDEGIGDRGVAADDRVLPMDLARAPATAGTPLNANATAALAVLAMSATAGAATDSGSVEIVRHETAGHIDPLAAVRALSAEERIALFS
jgi:chemotaxis regulatin CheY-phosphate phosphatase CheZ